MTQGKPRQIVRDTPCPHCGVLFNKNNLAMHVGAKHGGGAGKPSSPPETPKRAPRSRSDAAPAPAPAPAPTSKREYNPLDSETW